MTKKELAEKIATEILTSIMAVLENYLPDHPGPITGDFLLDKWNEILIEHDESISIPDLLDEIAIEINKEIKK